MLRSQVPSEGPDGIRLPAWAGTWPQRLALASTLGWVAFEDRNAFTQAAIVEDLATIRPENAAALGLDDAEIATAGRARAEALCALERFRYDVPGPAQGATGYWPRFPPPRGLAGAISHLAGRLESSDLQLWGDLAPPGQPLFPVAYRVWPDADTTAAALLARRLHDGRDADPPARRPTAIGLFGRYRDRPDTIRYAPDPDVLAPGSGAYLTWFAAPCRRPPPNEVDLVVNANVLAALGACGALDEPGVREASAWIRHAVERGFHREPRRVTTHYQYPWMVHRAVARAFDLGCVDQLGPAVGALVEEVRSSARRHDDGTVSWPGSIPVLSTLLAASVLVHAEADSALLDGAVRYLLDRQAASGAWRFGWVPMGSDEGGGMKWRVACDVGFTAQVLDLLCRYRLVRAVVPDAGPVTTGCRGH